MVVCSIWISGGGVEFVRVGAVGAILVGRDCPKVCVAGFDR